MGGRGDGRDEGVMKTAGERDYQGAGETFGGDRYVQYIDCSDGFTVSTCVKTQQIIYFKYLYFPICHLYLSGAISKYIYGKGPDLVLAIGQLFDNGKSSTFLSLCFLL